MNAQPTRFQGGAKQILKISMTVTLALVFLSLMLVVVVQLVPNSPSGGGGSLGAGKATEIPVSSDDAFVKGTLLLVNNSIKITEYPTDEELLVIRDNKSDLYAVNSSLNLRLRSEALTALNQMFDAYYAATQDNTIRVTSAYRSESDQAALTSSSVKAGYSEHHLGLSVALKDASGDIPDGHWILQNCYRFGFIQRYPVGKEASTGDTQRYTNCFRYVGVEHATYMYENNLSLEEYLEKLKTQTSYDGSHLSVTVDGKASEIYYIPANLSSDAASAVTTIKIPANCSYTYSGNNIDGFIITVTAKAS